MTPPHAPKDDLGAWVAAYGPALRRYFQRKVTPAEAEELVQDVFMAMHARGEGPPVENVQGYLFRIAAHLLAKRRGKGEPADFRYEDWDLPDEISPERLLITKQEMARVLVAVRNLPPRARDAFVFHRFEEMTYAAIAKRMGVSLSAIRQLIARAAVQVTEELGRAP